MEPVVLSGKKELDIYVNPTRQRLLRLMTLIGKPATPKQLSVEMGISPSAVQHHIGKLAELGLVELSHTEVVRGITAHYYRVLSRDVNVGGAMKDEFVPQRTALIREGVNAVLNGFIGRIQATPETGAEEKPAGDCLWGIARLKKDEAKQLEALVRRFLQEHDSVDGEGDPWEYVLVAYPVREGDRA